MTQHTETPTPRTDTLLSRGGLRPKPLTDLCRELERELADMTADYLRRHKDVGDMLERALAAETKLTTARLDLSAERDAVAQYIGERNGLQAKIIERSSHVIVNHHGQALACSESVSTAFGYLRTQLAQAQNEALTKAANVARLYGKEARLVRAYEDETAAEIEARILALKSPNSAEGEPG